MSTDRAIPTAGVPLIMGLLLCSACSCRAGSPEPVATYPGTYEVVQAPGQGGYLDVRSFASQHAAIDYAVTMGAPATLLVSQVEPVTQDLVVPAKLALQFAAGGQLHIAAGVIVGLDSPEQIQAGPRQHIFSGDGNVVFAEGGVIHVGWYGAVGDNETDDTAALQAALNYDNCNSVYKIVQLQKAHYLFSNLTIYGGTHLRGVGALGHSELVRQSGSTGIGIQDAQDNTGGYNIWFSHLTIDGNNVGDVDDTLIELGYGNRVWGVLSGMYDVYITNAPGLGLKGHTNVTYLDLVEFTDCTKGCWVDGGGSRLSNLSFSNCSTYGMALSATGCSIRGVHGEGAFGTAVINMDASVSLNSIDNVYCYIGAGNTTDTVIHLEGGARNNSLTNISVNKVNGTLTNGVIYDQSMAAARKIWGKTYGTGYLVPSYQSNTGWVASWGETASPTTGTWLKGDVVFSSSPDPGEAIGWVCTASGTPGTWAVTGTAPGDTAQSGDFTLTTADAGKRFSNRGASGTVRFTLPGAAPGMVYHFIRLASHTAQVQPAKGEKIRGGATGKSLELTGDGDNVSLMCMLAGSWEIVGGHGSYRFEP